MSDYQVLARRYRPQRFCEVVGQEPIVLTLKNAIKLKRTAHAYLFCGPRGTGKTTLARLFAKALNCLSLTEDCEPCNVCSSCKEITGGHSLDVLEIDGASNRGIEEIRQIKETVSYSTSSGHYRLYIIDEVHMLTKEAFNALLKTLEEPPEKVKFFFATTEPHKVPPTVLSRCQRFDLKPIPTESIVTKLNFMTQELKVEASSEGLRMIASRSGGSLRDAESLLDQVLSFQGEAIDPATVASILGLMPQTVFFALDRAGKNGDLAAAFDIVEQLFSQGKDLGYFVESLTEHFRRLLICQVAGSDSPLLALAEKERSLYEVSSKLYSQEQCLSLLEYLLQAQADVRQAPVPRIALESLLLHILRSHRRIPVDFLVRRLAELEQSIRSLPPVPNDKSLPAPKETEALPPLPATDSSLPTSVASSLGVISEDPSPAPAELPKAPIKGTTPSRSLKEEKVSLPSCKIDTVMQFAAVHLEGTLERKR